MMDREIETLEKAGTWKTVPCPPGKNVVGCKWVFYIKRKANGTVDKYKVWLVACGFTQILSWFHVGRFEFVYHLTVQVSFPMPRIMCFCYT